MTTETITNPEKRHDFLLLFDVTDGNPNGDPDAGNMPRIDPETGQGLVTDVCLKRKVRNYVELAAPRQPDKDTSSYKIFIREKAILNPLIAASHDQPEVKQVAKVSERTLKAREWMCQNYYDIRMFGAVLSTGEKEKNAGQVRGPLQLTFARSISPIVAFDVAITRMAVATEKEAEAQSGDNRTMGRKAILPYGLYLAKGFFSPSFATQTKVTSADLALFWDALQKMWEVDRSASRGMMSCRGLYVFSHENSLGNAPAHQLFDRFEAKLKEGSDAPRRFQDYLVYLNDRELPQGVTLTKLVGE